MRWDGIPTLTPKKEGDYLTDREADEATNFIRKHKDQPFFLSLSHYAVHSPLQAPEDLIDKYAVKEKTNQNIPTYAAMLECVDEAVGTIIKTLEEINLTDKTMIIFTSDNGGASHFPATDNTPLRRGKGFPYEGGIRVPLIVSWPGVVESGSICNEAVISMDFLPTVCEIAGANQPKAKLVDGISLMPLLQQSGSLPRNTLYWHFPHYWWGTNVQPYSIVRDGDWKLIYWYENERCELYNISDDLSETNDLAMEQPNQVNELETKLKTWLGKTGAKLPVKNPNYDHSKS
jgi:arylsulfatase A-like enzyme